VYVSIVSGASVEELKLGKTQGLTRRVTIGALAFILGFTVVFVALGATATWIGQVLLRHIPLITRIGGVVVILLGLHLTGLIKLPGLQYEKRLDATNAVSRSVGPLRAFLVGLSFAFGWTPCIGPQLSAILVYAANQETVYKGIYLLTVYSLGLGIPFLLAALGINRFLAASKGVKRHFRAIEVASGVIVIVVGLLMVSNKLSLMSSWASRLSGGT
jgi:cytochrome c-type biogenesis protein